ncbi:MAG: PKD domain-containing protein [Bacteroidales bacterium]|nr:PKD domain-containing protein [Bacteroidales bacterium]
MKTLNLHFLLVVIFAFLSCNSFAFNYELDGYVVVENVFLPVENQIVEFRNESGAIIASALTNEFGYYSKEIELPLSAQIINLSLSRSCSGEVFFYDHQMQLSSPHLGYTFLVCEDQLCEARFNYEQQDRNSLIVEFTNISVGNIVNYYWNFGDGTSSTEENPVHEYANANVYIVSLTVNGPNCTDAIARNVDVDFRDCLAKFSYNQVNQGQQLVIEFKNESQGQNLQYYWEFGPGGFSFEENPVYAFDAAGIFSVRLRVAGQGCINLLEKIVEVAPLPGSFALFENSQMFSPDFPVQFTDLSVGKKILYWVWLFGDGTTSIEINPLHQYAEPGIYEASLRVISVSSQSFYTRIIEVVESTGCIADFEYNQPNPDNPQISFNSLTANGNLQFLWDFGDGETSNEKSPAHQFDDFGTYHVSLSILGYGCTNFSTQAILIEEPVYCGAKFNFEQAFPQSREIHFVDQSFGDELIYLWEFGDGETSAQSNPVHLYQSFGQYEVKLLILNPQDCTDSSFATIEILPPLTISGYVFAGNNALSLGSVNLYMNLENEQIEFLGNSSLDEGFFEFYELLPGDYFVQAIPEFEFPFPIIPFYYPVYSGEVTFWQDATLITPGSASQNVNLNLGRYNDFFDGRASLSGKIIQSGTDADIPCVVYLSDESDEIFQFRLSDTQGQFSFIDIPYGRFKIRPEKPGKVSEAFEVSVDEATPALNHILFHETALTIVPDLSSLAKVESASSPRFYPNPANSFFKIHLPPDDPNKIFQLKIFRSVSGEVVLSEMISENTQISLSGYNDGLYLVEIFNGQNFIYHKLFIRH